MSINRKEAGSLTEGSSSSPFNTTVTSDVPLAPSEPAVPTASVFRDIADLLDIIGPGVVLLRWPSGIKGTEKKWKYLTAEHMTAQYLDALKGCNVGVALGRKSRHLVAIDFDRDELVEPFLEANPNLRKTLQTRGARGRVFWLRMSSDSYPRQTAKLRTPSGQDGGEFRSDGSQSIIMGNHPSGRPYTIVHKGHPVLTTYESIVWKGCSPISKSSGKCPDLNDTEDTEGTEDTDAISLRGVWLTSIDEAVRLSIPTVVHENHRLLFKLARGLKSFEKHIGQKLTEQELELAFDHWHAESKRFLRRDLGRDDYRIEFYNAYQSARIPLGATGLVLARAWKLANEDPLPPEATDRFSEQKKRVMVAFCYQLQKLNGEEPFYLAARTLQKFTGDETHIPAAKFLKGLCSMRILQEVEKGRPPDRASRYRYLAGRAPRTDDPGLKGSAGTDLKPSSPQPS